MQLFAKYLLAPAHGLATCAQGALAKWAGPARAAFDIAPPWRPICGVSIGYASARPVNQFNPGRPGPAELRLRTR